jgi:hypothetical protein
VAIEEVRFGCIEEQLVRLADRWLGIGGDARNMLRADVGGRIQEDVVPDRFHNLDLRLERDKGFGAGRSASIDVLRTPRVTAGLLQASRRCATAAGTGMARLDRSCWKTALAFLAGDPCMRFMAGLS